MKLTLVFLLTIDAGMAATYNVTSAPFNARGDGFTDDTASIQAAIEAARTAGGGTIFLPSAAGCYIVDHLDWYSNIDLRGEARSVCIKKKASPPWIPYSRRALINDAGPNMENVSITHITLDGNRSEQPGVYADENGWYGILLRGSSHIRLEHLTIVDAATDGIMISGSGPQSATGLNDVYINDVRVARSRRNNMSILHGANIFVRNSTFEEAAGTAPEAGVDIEPFTAAESLSNITFERVTFRNNGQTGLLVYNAFADQPRLGLRLTDCIVTGNGREGVAIGGGYKVTGMDISGFVSYNNRKQPWYARAAWYRGIVLSGVVDARLANLSISETMGSALRLAGNDNFGIAIANAFLSGGHEDLSIDAGATATTVYNSTSLANSRLFSYSSSTEYSAGTAPRITTTSLATAIRNRPFSQKLTAIGDGPVTWTVARGSLPSGLNLSNDGVLSGATLQEGEFIVTVQAGNRIANHQCTFEFLVLPEPDSAREQRAWSNRNR